MVIGPFINGAAIAVGALSGAAAGPRFPERLRNALPLSFGVCALGLGVSMIVKLSAMPPVVLALLLGSALGELLRLEDRLGSLAGLARGAVSRSGGAGGGPAGAVESGASPGGGVPSAAFKDQAFAEKYVALIVLFSASGLGIFGAIDEGLGNGAAMLSTKAILDFFTAMIFAASLGPAVALICLPQMAVQLSLVLGAGFLSPHMTPALSGNFSALGGLVMLAAGLRIAGIKNFPVANMLPGLVFVMPLTSLWKAFF